MSNAPKPTEPEADPARIADPRYSDATGIYVRARGPGGYDSFDIATLSYDSLMTWLRSRGGQNEWAESVVAALLGHRSHGRAPVVDEKLHEEMQRQSREVEPLEPDDEE